MSKRKFLISSVLLALLIAIAGMALPWKFWVEKKLITMFKAQGFQDVSLTVSTLGWHGISLENISFGRPTPLVLKNVTIDYSLPDLWHGRIHTLAINGLDLDFHQNGTKWVVSGLEDWHSGTHGGAGITVPVTPDQLAVIPLDGVKLENGSLHVASKQWQLDIPLQVSAEKFPVPKISHQAPALKFTMRDMEINTGEASLEASLDEERKKWKGAWHIRNIALTGGATPIPILEGSGTVIAEAHRFNVRGGFKSADKHYRGNFSLDYALDAPDKSVLTLLDATVPWSSGTLSVQDLKLPLAGNKAIAVNLKVQHVSLDALMQMLTGKKASATGTVSGVVPMTIAADGAITFQQGSLQADKPGTIIMQPETIPGDNAQIVLVRDIMKNLHYTHLSIAVGSNEGKTLSVLLTLEGNNPDVHKGRPVKLNVHLTGDVLGLVHQSIMPFINPEQLLQ